MGRSIAVTARIAEDLSADLDRLAKDRNRSRAWLVDMAIARYVAEELALRNGRDTADEAIGRGESLALDDFMTERRMEAGRRHAA